MKGLCICAKNYLCWWYTGTILPCINSAIRYNAFWFGPVQLRINVIRSRPLVFTLRLSGLFQALLPGIFKLEMLEHLHKSFFRLIKLYLFQMKYQRPASGSANPASRAGEPVTSAAQHRATSAPARPSNIGTKENFGQANSTTAVQYSRNVNYTNRRNDQGAHKSPLVEKQAWAVEMSGERQLEGNEG